MALFSLYAEIAPGLTLGRSCVFRREAVLLFMGGTVLFKSCLMSDAYLSTPLMHPKPLRERKDVIQISHLSLITPQALASSRHGLWLG